MMQTVKRLGKTALRTVLDDYRLNYILATSDAASPSTEWQMRKLDEVGVKALLDSETEQVRKAVSYAQAGMEGFAVMGAEERPVCVAHFATPELYSRSGTWPLRAGEVALMDIVTEPSYRGKGLAGDLMASAANLYLSNGTVRLIAFVWWSNTPSLRAFAKAGWRKIGFSIELRIAGRWFALRFPLPFA